MKHPARTGAMIALTLVVATGSGAWWISNAPSAGAQTAPAAAPVVMHDEGYVGSAACDGCHERNFETWHASYHRTMTQAATPEAVLAPFEGTTPAFEGKVWKLEREGDEFFATPHTLAGTPLAARMQIVLTTGSHHYQVYWMALRAAPELAQLPLVWHIADRDWVPRKSMFLDPPKPETHPETGRWPQTCMNCHATNGTKSHPSAGTTTIAELGISCEACHGPGAAHVALQRELERTGAQGDGDALITNPKALPHDRASQVCGQCHGIHPLTTPEARAAWEREGTPYRPGEDLDVVRPTLRGVPDENSDDLRAFIGRHLEELPNSFWPDGEVRVSGRDYNGLIESPCYQRGELSCLSCHEMHPSESAAPDLRAWADDQLRPGMYGSQACVQCHSDHSEPERVAAHTHHAPTSSGSECMNCHMTHTTYGLTKAIRSHTITSPSIAGSLASGKPNACNQCHLDRTLGWAADRMQDWYGHARPELSADQESTAASVLWALQGDPGLRALTAWNLGWQPARAVSGTGWMPFLVSTLLQDEYDVVRRIAMRTARLDPKHADFRLQFTQDLEKQRDAVRATVLEQWMRNGLSAAPGQRSAVLVRDDGTLDEERFRRLYAQRSKKHMRLNE